MFGFGGGDHVITGQRGDFQQLAEVRAYWEAKRMGAALPLRADIDPRGMAQALEQVFLVEQIAPNHGRLRLAGMHLSDLLGMDVRGMPITSLLEPVARARLSEALGGLFRGEYVLDLWLVAERGIGRPALEARMVLLPLIGSHGEPDLALGCLVTKGELGRAPRRFAIARLMREALPEQALRKSAGFVETRDRNAPPPVVHLAARARPHLRLVSSRE